MRSADKSTGERGLDRKQLPNLDRDDKKDCLARKRGRKLDKDSEKDRLDRITPHNLDRILMRSIGKLTGERAYSDN